MRKRTPVSEQEREAARRHAEVLRQREQLLAEFDAMTDEHRGCLLVDAVVYRCVELQCERLLESLGGVHATR